MFQFSDSSVDGGKPIDPDVGVLEGNRKSTSRGNELNSHPDLLRTSLVQYVSQRTVHTLSIQDHEGEQAPKQHRQEHHLSKFIGEGPKSPQRRLQGQSLNQSNSSEDTKKRKVTGLRHQAQEDSKRQ